VLADHIKNDLFPKAKFVLGKDKCDVGRMIYKDHIKCCEGRIGLGTMMDSDRESHMKNIHMTALTNLSVMIKTLNLENQPSKMQIKKKETADQTDWNCGLQS
jgi:hypothetical protein